jgi:hypothetical protein
MNVYWKKLTNESKGKLKRLMRLSEQFSEVSVSVLKEANKNFI